MSSLEIPDCDLAARLDEEVCASSHRVELAAEGWSYEKILLANRVSFAIKIVWLLAELALAIAGLVWSIRRLHE